MLQEQDKLITLSRTVEVVEIPSGVPGTLAEGTPVRIMQSLGGSYTVTSERGYMYRVDARDVDALGISNATTTTQELNAPPQSFNENMVREQLRSVYDPEIPVNIVDLGLIYSCVITPLPDGKKIDVKMSMTAPGCGMGDVLKAEVESKLSRLPEVKEVQVEVVFDPPWNAGLMSEAAKLQLGFDLDSGGPQSGLPVYR